jgi:hypothetical protein
MNVLGCSSAALFRTHISRVAGRQAIALTKRARLDCPSICIALNAVRQRTL